jgi:glyoxylase-like metal-dependent hydrolase (beta-lactamase superfamily II)
MDFRITTIVNGSWEQNCYLIINNVTRQVVILDPGSDFEKINKEILDSKLIPVGIINTHAHFDHVGAVSDLVNEYLLKFYLHEADLKLLQQANLYKLVFQAQKNIKLPREISSLSGSSSILNIGGFKFKWHLIPGHTCGSVLYKINDCLFTGDTFFKNGPGRTDLPGGSPLLINASIAFIKTFPLNTVIYPGHGRCFKISESKF